MKTEIPIEQSYTYHIIDTPELKQKFSPKLATDEVFTNYNGQKFRSLHPDETTGVFFKDFIYRRRIDPGEGFRLVGLDEILLTADEGYNGNWNPISVGSAINTVRTILSISSYYCAYRRLVTPPTPQFGWVKLPEVPKDDRIYIVQLKDGFITQFDAKSIRVNVHVAQWLNYSDPEPVKSADELAFESWHKNNFWKLPEGSDAVKETWLAALAWERSRK